MSKTRIKKKVSSVSIVTISQYTRFDCLQNLYELIKLQTYKNIIEWVIVEGSKKKSDANLNKSNIDYLSQESGLSFPIKYIEFQEDVKLGELRNIGNKKSFYDSYSSIIFYVLKFSLITLFLYLIIYNLRKQ